MSMSLEEQQQSVESQPLSSASNTTKSDTPNQSRHQQTEPSLNHHNTEEYRNLSPTANQSYQAPIINSTRSQHPQTDIMAMHNFGPNSSQHEHQLKNQQTSGTDSSSWHNNTSNNNNNSNSGGSSNNTNNDSPSTMSNTDHATDLQQSSGVSNLNEQKLQATESPNPKGQTNSRSTLNRHQQQQQQSQLQSQSQQYHGIFTPQIPAILHSSLASRVDQIIRTTLHDSPAYTPQTSRNNVNTNINVNGADNSTNTLNSIPSSNMPLSSSSSSHIFNTAAGSVSTSVPQSISSHMVANTCGGPMSAVTTTAPITSIYGSTLSTISDNPNNTPNSNLVAKTSPSHSALAAAAALQSLNQAHVQRSHQQQMAHTQSSPFSSVSGLTTKPPSNGTPVPQAAHGGSIHQMSKLNPTSMANLEQQNQLSFASDHSSSGSLNFSSRLHPNNLSSGNNLSSKMVNLSNTGSSSMNWQDQMQANGMLSRLPPLHGLNGSMPPFLTSSQGPYGVVSSQLLGGLGSNNGNNMIGTDGDTLSKLNLMKNSPGHNPMQFRDEKSFPMNFPNLISNKQNQSDIENLRGPSQNPSHDTTLPKGVTNERLVVFAYNLLSQGIPGKQQPKKVVHLDDGMRTAIQNGEFYSKYSAIANGIISNQMIVPNFSIIDYLRKDKFHMTEIDAIERINSGLGICDLLCLMELVKQRPWPSEKSGSDLSKSSQYPDMSSLHTGNLMSSSQPDHSALLNHHNSPQKVNFLSTSPERSELLGLQGVDRSRRSSQSPSQMSNTNLKFMNAHNSSLIHQQQSPAINPHIFTSPLCPPSQQQHTSPQANRSSPFQPPMSVGSSHSIARPPRSHSTIVGHGTSPLNPPYSLTPSLARPPPPAAHQSSSRPNLAVLDMQPIPAHSGVTSVPVTAHMSSKLPQTPKLQDSLPRPNSKSSQQIYQPFVNPKLIGKETTLPSHLDFQSPSRFELDPNQVLSIQATNGPRQQDLANRDLKRSTTPHYIPNNMLSGVNQVDFVRQHELSDGSMGTQQHMSQLGMSNYTANARSLFDRNLSQVNNSNSTMPPPSTSNTTNDLNCRGQSGISGSDTKQYNALVAAYQQQIMMSRKLGDNHPGALNVMGSVPGYMVMNQPGSQRLPVGEPMHVDILQQARQPATQMNSPKSNNQRSIITGSGAGPARKTKKPKSSPPTGAQPLDGNTAMNESLNSTNTNVSLSDSSGSVTHGAMPIQTKENQTDRTNIQEVNQPSNDSLTDNIELGAGNAIAISGAETVRMESVPSEISALTEISARGCGNTGNDQTKNHVDLTLNLRQTGADDILNPTANVEINVNIKEIQSEPSSESAKLNPSVHAGPNSTVVDQPSKYQKLFTKKAWLKNYDLEDQARSIEETAAADETMPALTRNSVKIEDKPKITTDESVPKEDKPQSANVKGVSGTKNGKTKADNKKKAKDSKAAKSNATCSLKSNKVASIKNTDNDSEETNASTSDLDDTDETDSVKSTNDKKLRRMPRRKVKLSSDREFSDSASASNKAKAAKDVSDKESSVRGRVKKEKVTGSSSDALPSLTKRKHNSDDESVKHKVKKIKESNKHTDKSNLSPVSKAKKRSGEKFLQTQPCYEILPKSSRCLECRRVRQSSLKGDKTVQSKQASKTNWDDFCRFFEFRKLRYNKSAQIVVAGFSEATDAKDSDMRLWLPLEDGEVPKNISYKVAKFILANIGDEFCKIVLQERAALKSYESTSGKKTTWKRAVYGLRELCDVCSTTLFNCHYVCDRCGFVVCLDCHETRSLSDKGCDVNQDITEKDPSEVKVNCENNNADTEQTNVSNKKSKKDSRGWIFCAKNEEHSDDRLTLTKIIAGNCLEEVWALMHEIREKLNLGECSCAKSNNSFQTSIENVEKEEFDSSIVIKQEIDDKNESSHSTLKGLLLASNDSPMNGSSDSKQNNILKMDAKAESKISDSDVDLEQPEMDFGSEDDSRQVSAAIEGCIASLAADVGNDTHDDKALNSNIDSNSSHTSSKLCHGDLLVLSHSHHKDNVRLFREHWRLGKPVLVRGVHDRMNIDMWLPQFFLGKFGDYRSDLVDCRNGDIHRQSMRKYWDGFEPSSTKKKSKDDITPSHIPPANNEEPSAITTSYYSGTALWRLKDWPPGQDFNEILPEHYYDFMSNLPLKSYTTRSGKLNLACRLPKEMLKPDLGPKMYSAYGTTRFPERGTTNLHLDISDAVNVMIYVGGAMPFKQGSSDHAEIYDNTINDCFVDTAMKDQIRQQKLIPGALWHIFKPTDAEKMREFLNMVSDECKISHEKRIDPIHDQTWYLDQNLLDRLQREYGVKSYPILQCMGDAILIPAGAPHQVKNLQNCIKVANDFVSPENIRYCLKLTNEFRNLPETHINQEDKLQIKNIMYHSVKESIQYIKMFESGKVTLDDESSDEDDCSDVEYKTNQPDAS